MKVFIIHFVNCFDINHKGRVVAILPAQIHVFLFEINITDGVP